MTNTDKLYTYYPEFDADDFLLWKIYEYATEQVIAETVFEEDAQEYIEFLKSGGGFAGFTPKFVLTKITNPNINDAFTAEFA